MTTTVQTITVDGVDLFYREAGRSDAPVVLLLHGFPSSSFQYRNLITKLAHEYHVLVGATRLCPRIVLMVVRPQIIQDMDSQVRCAIVADVLLTDE
jgi:pimeloyl-ACP methyl ester carboxylesterase